MNQAVVPQAMDFAGYYQRRTRWSAMVMFAYVGLNFLLAFSYRSWLLGLPADAPTIVWILEWGLIVPASALGAAVRWRKFDADLTQRVTLACIAVTALAIIGVRYAWVKTGAEFFSVLNCYYLIFAMVMTGLEYRRLCVIAFPVLIIEIGLSYHLYGWGPTANFEALSLITAGFVVFVTGWQVEGAMRQAWDEGRYYERLALRDSLTGLLNRRGFEERAARVLAQAAQGGKSAIIAILDLDQFKSFNERYGQVAGDRALRTLGRVLTRYTQRAFDVAARIGGEEFVVLWHDVSEDWARARVKALVESVRDMDIRHEHSSCGVLSASIGAHFLTVVSPETLGRLLQRADRNLHAAKQQGGNQSVLSAAHDAGAEPETPKSGAASDTLSLYRP